MKKPKTVEIRGRIRDIDGSVYDGAIIEVFLNTQENFSGNVIGNRIHRTFSNSFGFFTLNLVPNVENTYYTITIKKENVFAYYKIVSNEDIGTIKNFLDLKDKKPKEEIKTTISNNNLGIKLINYDTYIVDDNTLNTRVLSGELVSVYKNGQKITDYTVVDEILTFNDNVLTNGDVVMIKLITANI